ncbi:MAG: hypothetical protein SGJ09_14700 [Phycisphaerae bacterium]|nr:hypothetical protein [Phycisphaerae bacterium]
MAIDLSIWLAWFVGFAIAITLIGFTWHALFANKSRGRPRCPRCWHDLSGATTRVCAECGRETLNERDVYRTRRSYSRAALALGLLVAGALYLRIQVTQQGVIAFLPASAVVWLLPHVPLSQGPMGEVQTEIISRITSGAMDVGTLKSLVSTILEGDSDAVPGSDEWQMRYGRVATGIVEVASAVTDRDSPIVQAASALRALPPRITILAGGALRVDAPIPVNFTFDDWWPFNTEARVRIVDRADHRTNDAAEVWGLRAGAPPRPLFLELAPQAPGEIERRVDVGVRTRATDENGKPLPDETGDGAWSDERVVTIVVPLKPPLVTPALTPLKSEAADLVVGSVFSQGVIRWQTGVRPVAFWFDLQRTATPEFDGVLFGIEIELRENDFVRRSLRTWWAGGPRGVVWRAEIVREDLEALARLPADGAGWTVRVRSVEDVALRALVPVRPAPDAATPADNPPTKFWVGDITMPATITTRTGESPVRRWFRPNP